MMMIFLAVLLDWEKQLQDKNASKTKAIIFIQVLILV
jgi:hypothetical protein